MESSRGELGGAGKVGTIIEPLPGADGGVGIVDVPASVSVVGSSTVELTFESVLLSASVAGVEPAEGRTISITLTLLSEESEAESEPSVAASVAGLSAGSGVGVSVAASGSGKVVGKGVGEVTAPVPVLGGVLEPDPALSESAARAARL